MQRLISLTKRTVAVNLAGIENGLKTGKVGGARRQIKGRELKYDITANAGALAEKIKALLQVAPGDDTNVQVLGGGKQLLVQVPTARVNAASEFVVGMTAAAGATTEAIVQQFKADITQAPMVHASVWGEYPQTVGMNGGNVASVLNIPQNDEGLGFALRNVMANHLAAITKRNAMNSAALASIYEQIGEFEMGNAFGIFERHQLLGMAYQGLNANNMVYDCVKANGKTGTIGTVVQTTVAKAIEDKVIKAGKKFPSGYTMYEANDVSMWNAYCAAGVLAATMVNCGALRGAQAVSSTLWTFVSSPGATCKSAFIFSASAPAFAVISYLSSRPLICLRAPPTFPVLRPFSMPARFTATVRLVREMSLCMAAFRSGETAFMSTSLLRRTPRSLYRSILSVTFFILLYLSSSKNRNG
eukprot:TRINITY_DN746_c0_g1_i1.p1 TRINITY_DN746_c0_g1~~TRINITY_DN746_c0_g1_i1.p1  ORF type:complete len:415 (+),score=38.00 TRINITY_DN746_c0_g1_i1:794-2038(+)